MQRLIIIVCGIIWALVFNNLPSAAQQANTNPQAGQTAYSFSALPLHQFDTDLDGGGQVSVDRYSLGFNINRQLTASIEAGLGLSYDYEDWNFSGAHPFSATPWTEIHRQGLDFSLTYTGVENWSFHFIPSVQFARESDADWDDSLIYGAVAMANYRFNPRLTLGIGAGAYREIEQTQIFPFVTVYWQITDRVRLTNPLRSGPSGAAGLELAYAYKPDRQVEFAFGGAWRSFRFRLNDEGASPKGIGEVDLIPLWGRATFNLSSQIGLDLYAGYAFDGTLRLEDSDGNLIDETDQDPAPFAALVLRATF
jgi:hypothetical protein